MDRPLQEVQNVIKLPVYDVEQRRPVGTSGTFLGQRYHNCWPEIQKNVITGEFDTKLIKRPALRKNNTTALNPTIESYGTGNKMTCLANISMTQVADVCVAAFFDGNNSKIYIIQYRPTALTTVKIGELTTTTKNDYIFLTEIQQNTGGTYPAGTLTPGVAISYMKSDRSVGAGYYATTTAGVFTAGSLTTISSGSFPSNLGTPKVITGRFVQMNGVNYIMTIEGTIYASGGTNGALFDISLWNTNAITIASMHPDSGVTVMRYKNVILAVGTSTIEFFTDAAIPPPASPLERAEQAFIRFGCVSPKMIININDTVYWMAYSDNGTIGVYSIDGYKAVKISTAQIDDAIAYNFAGAATWPNNFHSMECVMLYGKIHLAVNGLTLRNALYYIAMPAGTETYPIASPSEDVVGSIGCYSVEDKIWWGMGVGGDNSHGSGIGSSFISTCFNGFLASGSPFTNYVFRVGTDTSAGNLDGLLNTRVLSFTNTAGTSSGLDAFLSGDDPVCSVWQTNNYWFNTEKSKRINRVSVICERMAVNSGDATADYQIYLQPILDSPNLLDTSTLTLLSGTARSFTLPSNINFSGRITWNNLGRCRSLELLVVSKSNSAFDIHGLEIHLDQGTR